MPALPVRLSTHAPPHPLLQVLAITTGLSICSFMAVFFTVLLLAPLLPMAKGMSAAQLEALAALAGVLAIARSPASAVRGASLTLCTVSRDRPAWLCLDACWYAMDCMLHLNLSWDKEAVIDAIESGVSSAAEYFGVTPAIANTVESRPRLTLARNSSSRDLQVAELLSAVQIAVLKETDGRGPFCSLVMAVVVVKDVVTFVCFAINMEFASAVSRCASASKKRPHGHHVACLASLCV